MVPDAEILAIVCECLTALDIGEYTVKINHRKILDGIFELAGVPADKTRSISSAVDKLDKVGTLVLVSPVLHQVRSDRDIDSLERGAERDD